MKRNLRIAVTGVAGASGQSAVKMLRMMSERPTVIPVDVTPYSAGLYMTSIEGVVLPKPEHDIQAWVDFVEKQNIDAIIPGADRDLIPLSAHAAEVKALVSRPKVIEIADDKYKTACYLDDIGIPVPDFDLPEGAENWDGFPCVVKPRSDAASRGFHVCADREELNFHLKHTCNPMIQEYVSGDEITANVFVDRDGEPVAHLVMLRKERGGIAIQAKPVEDADIRDMLYKIGRELRPKGILSVQLRKQIGVPLPFEINARVSGSGIVRALCGYNDVAMLVRHYLLDQPITPPIIDYRKHYFRYYSEIGVDSDDIFESRQKHGEMGVWR